MCMNSQCLNLGLNAVDHRKHFLYVMYVCTTYVYNVAFNVT